MALPVGSKAPDFSLKSKKGDTISDVRLADSLGKQNVVLLFFPLAFTGVCPTEMCDITAGLGAYDGLNARIIGISVDSPFSQDAWASKEKIGITLASDLGGKVATAYSTLLADLGGFAPASARAAIIIDKAGVIQYSEQTPTPKELPNFEAVKAKLAELN